ncbi:thiopeptide maturation pyridine synthase [Actinomadura xylanilytica]|uniref:thiopeptide maturation pyridine synthase n=1 Tax=Actinomadura xylanilytica TaxID=887459 RepID=UPI00255ADB2D|nr:thiopeptide maturation pyridine synthase [Actinomadura xylanilytica]MDL4773941.1 lantibiotic dehydratase C-terminal domain-containing protein [Actinomadura xylanilytica]
MRSHSFRIHYHEGGDRLVLEGIRPVLRRIAGEVDHAYFARHWIRGPHVRLNVQCEPGVLEAVARPAVDEVLGGFLAEHPSRARLNLDEHLPMHRRLAELESETEDLLPWHADNSIHLYAGPEPSPEDESSARLLADFYTATNELVFAALDDVASGARRLGIAFDLMICTAHALSGVGLARGGLSFRSHAEAFLHGYPEGHGLRRAWDEHYGRNAAVLVDRVRAVVSTVDGTEGSSAPVPHVRSWNRALGPFRARAERMAASGGLDEQAPPPGLDVADLTQVSPFHRELFASAGWQEQTDAAGWFLCYKLLLNYTYLHLTRLGVTPTERFLLCHLAASAVEEAHGISALDLVRTLADPSLPPAEEVAR